MAIKPTKKGYDPRSTSGITEQDVDEIKKEMEADGFDLDKKDEDEDEQDIEDKKSKKKPAKKAVDDEDDEEAEDDDDEDGKKKDKKSKANQEDEDEDEEATEDEEDDDDNRQKRPQRFVEPWELGKLEGRLSKKLEGFAEDLKKLLSKPDTAKNDEKKDQIVEKIGDEVSKVAEELGLDPAATQKLADAILSQVKLPKDLSDKLDTLDEIKKGKEQDEFWKTQDSKFNEEFNELRDSDEFSEDLKKLSGAELKELKTKLNQLAFTKRYSGYSLVDLLELKHDDLMPEKKKSATNGRGGSQRNNGGADVSGDTELTAEQINELSDEEFDAYAGNMKKKRRAPLKRRGATVK